MDTFFDIMYDTEQRIRDMINTAPWEKTNGEELGLDARAGYQLWVSEDDGIVVSKDRDRSLQYYGGFEYVKEEYRCEIGEWVFYSSGSSRVQECIDCYYRKAIEEVE